MTTEHWNEITKPAQQAYLRTTYQTDDSGLLITPPQDRRSIIEDFLRTNGISYSLLDDNTIHCSFLEETDEDILLFDSEDTDEQQAIKTFKRQLMAYLVATFPVNS